MSTTTPEHWRWPNFERSEFLCSHCGEFAMHPETLDKLQALRRRVGRPLVITSGYRCRSHPIERAKPSGPGSHATGRAVDIRAIGSEAIEIVRHALPLGFTGVGISQRGGQPRFVHLDDVPTGQASGIVRPMMWSY